MSFGETGHPNSKAAAIWMRPNFVESADELNQIARVLERIARFIEGHVARPIAPERQNISNRRLGVSLQNRIDLFLVVANAGEVRCRIQFRCMLDSLHKIVS